MKSSAVWGLSADCCRLE